MANLIPGLSRSKIEAYYKRPAVQELLLPQLRNRNVTVIQTGTEGSNILKRRRRAGKYIRIPSATKLEYFTDRRHTEFHPATGKTTTQFIVDIDPGPDASFGEAKRTARAVVRRLREVYPGQPDIAFSGGTGFHVRHPIGYRMDTGRARERLKTVLEGIPGTTFAKPQGSEVRLDMVAMKPMGSVRAVGSLNAETGLRAMTVDLDALGKFKPDMAKVGQHVLVSGRPGSGKTTYVEQLRARLGLPVVNLDFMPERWEALQRLRAAQQRLDETEQRLMREVLARKEPHIIEGWQLMNLEKAEVAPHTRYLIDPGRRRSIAQFIQREIGKDPSAHLPSVRRRAASLAGEADEAVQAFRSLPGTLVKRPRFKEAQFAPGLPSKTKFSPIRPGDIGDPFLFALQKHKTDRQKGRPHLDMRLVNEDTGVAHSWALPKAQLPKRKGEKLLAIQQPDHTADYATGFQGRIEPGEYGAGTVSTKPPKPMDILKADIGSIVFEVLNGSRKVYNLRQMGQDPTQWLIQKLDARRHSRGKVNPVGIGSAGVESIKPPKAPKIAPPPQVS